MSDAVQLSACIEPAADVWPWIRETFLAEGAPLLNPDHEHLIFAHVGVLWTNVDNVRQRRRVVGMAEIPNTRGNAWAKARAEQQLAEWFGAELPDFVITLSAPFCAQADDGTFCALVEHECYHLGQARDGFGFPRFSRETGRPIWAIRNHDVEEFVGVVRRYGARGTGVQELVDAAATEPLIKAMSIAGACGTCEAMVA